MFCLEFSQKKKKNVEVYVDHTKSVSHLYP
jgi:hypothetical protein